MSSNNYAVKQAAAASYRPKGYGVSPSLQRARKPYALRNALTGAVIAAFAVGVWAYSISAVKQDNFDDVDALALSVSPEEKRRRLSIEDMERKRVAAGAATGMIGAAAAVPDAVVPVPVFGEEEGLRPMRNFGEEPKTTLSRGMGATFLSRYLYPTQRTIVWDAPPIDQFGKWSDRVVEGPRRV